MRRGDDQDKRERWRIDVGARGRVWSIAAAMAMVALIGLADLVSGADIGLSLFYLLPVALASWYAGVLPGIAVTVVSGIVWYLADVMADHLYPHPAIALWNAFIRVGMFAAVSISLSRLRAALDREKRLSRSDPLTGAWNSRAFHAIVKEELARCRRYSRPVSLVFLDVDDFKRVNDGLGHAAGDLALQSITKAMGECLREVDTLARLGGDEFAVLLPETGAEDAVATAAKILRRAAEDAAESGFRVTLSAGVATCAASYPGADELIGRADELMYRAKAAGKNTLQQIVV